MNNKPHIFCDNFPLYRKDRLFCFPVHFLLAVCGVPKTKGRDWFSNFGVNIYCIRFTSDKSFSPPWGGYSTGRTTADHSFARLMSHHCLIARCQFIYHSQIRGNTGFLVGLEVARPSGETNPGLWHESWRL